MRRHQMETLSAWLAICAGNSPIPGEFPAQRPVTRSFEVFFDLRLNKRLSKQSWGWWFQTLSCPLWRHRTDYKETRETLTLPWVPELDLELWCRFFPDLSISNSAGPGFPLRCSWSVGQQHTRFPWGFPRKWCLEWGGLQSEGTEHNSKMSVTTSHITANLTVCSTAYSS